MAMMAASPAYPKLRKRSPEPCVTLTRFPRPPPPTPNNSRFPFQIPTRNHPTCSRSQDPATLPNFMCECGTPLPASSSSWVPPDGSEPAGRAPKIIQEQFLMNSSLVDHFGVEGESMESCEMAAGLNHVVLRAVGRGAALHRRPPDVLAKPFVDFRQRPQNPHTKQTSLSLNLKAPQAEHPTSVSNPSIPHSRQHRPMNLIFNVFRSVFRVEESGDGFARVMPTPLLVLADIGPGIHLFNCRASSSHPTSSRSPASLSGPEAC